MARVTRIDILVTTTGIADGGATNGRVYAGVGGMEFVLDTAGNDFQASSQLVYVIGEGSNLTNRVDLEFVLMDTADVLAFPVYIRFEPNGALDKWKVDTGGLRVTVNPSEENLRFVRPFTESFIFLSNDSGKYIYMRPEA
jgi:hypothetical protein